METQLYHTLLCSSPLFIALGSQFICELFPTNMRVFALFFFAVIATFLLLPNAVLCDACLASRFVYKLRDEPCSSPDDFHKEINSENTLADFLKLLKKCHIAYNSTVDGIMLPACVPHLDPKSVADNYTKSHDVDYINSKNFTGAGVGTSDDWIVLVLSTNTSTGNFANGGSSSLVVARGGCIGIMVGFLGLFVLLLF
ncbi:uncharacterized GPI-anchored protein At3g06035-like isoform X2 [Cucurbita moschata]|uniref:Uncharacterized GPI-anchored protein At3g06035-like isoform X2 n=1 Tax=Cucurbita moschata TaxID=3662 RepID=A0A6J1HCG9_CUCMO|nr:uncharacterized GPI-anchored protein At3g06035-like isoform X2 [Cucurbita moschata]